MKFANLALIGLNTLLHNIHIIKLTGYTMGHNMSQSTYQPPD
jgi:hypothetical protein